MGPELIAERLLDALEQPFKLGADKDTRVTVTASIGIAAGEQTSAEELLREADIAMYRAKWDGKNRYVVFETGMQDTMQNRMELEMDLREALGERRVLPRLPAHVRPQRHEPHRSRGPDPLEAPGARGRPARRLHPAAGGDGADHRGRQVGSGEACAQGAAWRAAGYPIGMAVNVSGRQLDTDQLVTDIEEALCDSGLDPEALTIEITETTLMRNVEETARRLTAIKALGVRIAIDDFGTGYSSLAHLQRFPVDALKIDRSFISGLQNNQEGETLIHTLVQLGKALSIETFAEGIEQQQELSLLQGRGLRQRAGLPVRPSARRGRHRGVPSGLGRREVASDQHGLTGFAGDRFDLLGGALELGVGEHGGALERQFALELDPGLGGGVLVLDLHGHRPRDAVGAQQQHVQRLLAAPAQALFGVAGCPHVERGERVDAARVGDREVPGDLGPCADAHAVGLLDAGRSM